MLRIVVNVLIEKSNGCFREDGYLCSVEYRCLMLRGCLIFWMILKVGNFLKDLTNEVLIVASKYRWSVTRANRFEVGSLPGQPNFPSLGGRVIRGILVCGG